MDQAIKCDSKTHHHPEQLGDFAYLSDDVLGFIADFLPHKDVYHITLLSNSKFYTKILERRYYAFKNKRREKLERIVSMRDKNYQFANAVFTYGNCVVADCLCKRARLTHFIYDIYWIPYCSVCWKTRIMPKYS